MIFNLQTFILTLTFIAGALCSADAQTISILFEEGAVKVASVKEMEPQSIESGKDGEDPILNLFYKYYYPADLEEYKSLFLDDAYPVTIDESYALWRKNMEGVSIQVTSVYSALFRDQTTAIVNFDFIKRDILLKMTFFAKRIEGRWVPYDSEELVNMNGMRAFFPIVNEEVFKAWTGKSVAEEYAKLAANIKESCAGQSNSFSNECVYSVAEEWGISTNMEEREFAEKLLKRRIVQGSEESVIIDFEEINSAFNENDLEERDARVIAYYLNRGETMIAYHKIQSLAPDLAFEEINSRLQPVLKERALETQNIKFTDDNERQ